MDTESTSLASWQWAWRQHGLELDVSGFFADHGGDVNQERYAHLASAVGPAFSLEASHARRVAYREMLHRDLSLSAGIAGWLDQAGALGLRLAVASSSPGDWVRGHLSRVGVVARFEVLACGDEVARAKPDPGVYALAPQRLGVPAASAVAVEDTPHGVAGLLRRACGASPYRTRMPIRPGSARPASCWAAPRMPSCPRYSNPSTGRRWRGAAAARSDMRPGAVRRLAGMAGQRRFRSDVSAGDRAGLRQNASSGHYGNCHNAAPD
jgi:HAD superfamily hydrolase (TIGR01509 family)